MEKKSHDITNSLGNYDGPDDNYDKDASKNKNSADTKTPLLESFGRDLTRMAAESKLDPVVGRQKEIQRVSQILSRRKKNNAILIGEPGCVDGETLITIKKTSDENGHTIINK